MSYAFRIDEHHGCIFVKWRGLVTLADSEMFLRDVEASPYFRSGLHRLHDYRSADYTFTVADIRVALQETAMAGERHGFRKVAMLVPTDLAYGVSRMYQMLSNDASQDICSFRNLDDAMAWLDLPADIADPFSEIAYSSSRNNHANIAVAAMAAAS